MIAKRGASNFAPVMTVDPHRVAAIDIFYTAHNLHLNCIFIYTGLAGREVKRSTGHNSVTSKHRSTVLYSLKSVIMLLYTDFEDGSVDSRASIRLC